MDPRAPPPSVVCLCASSMAVLGSGTAKAIQTQKLWEPKKSTRRTWPKNPACQCPENSRTRLVLSTNWRQHKSSARMSPLSLIQSIGVHASNVPLVLEAIDGTLSLHRLPASPLSIVSTTMLKRQPLPGHCTGHLRGLRDGRCRDLTPHGNKVRQFRGHSSHATVRRETHFVDSTIRTRTEKGTFTDDTTKEPRFTRERNSHRNSTLPRTYPRLR